MSKPPAKKATAKKVPAKKAAARKAPVQKTASKAVSKRPAKVVPQAVAQASAVPGGYIAWLGELKQRIHAAQQRAAQAVNHELVLLYWQIGRDIQQRFAEQNWGSKIIDRLAQDLRKAFPDMQGFSPRNLRYMRSFAQAWPDPEILQQVAAKLPWAHQLVLLDKLPGPQTRQWYAAKAIEHGWSRNVLAMQIESRLLERSGKAVTNFKASLPKPQSDLARESLKDAYKLDFLGLGKEAEERAVEAALVQHVARFLVELGAGFAYVGRQVHVEVEDEDFFIDLLFYHLKLRCYVVVELKAGKFKPEDAGQLSFYMTVVDRQVKRDEDAPTIGLLLCKSKSRVVAEYALSGIEKPIGFAEYELVRELPKKLQTDLPSIEDIERELEHISEERAA